MQRHLGAVLSLSVLLAVGCDCSGTIARSCASDGECEVGQRCVDGRCAAAPDTGPVPETDSGMPGDDGGACARPCGASCCGAAETCVDGRCEPAGPACTSNDECTGDRYCDADLGRCVPWGEGGTDPSCSRVIVAGTFAPTVQCELSEAPPLDPFPAHLHVLSTPMVADFRVGRSPDDPPRPSIVAVFDDGEDGSSELPTGVIRVLDGATCAQQAELGSLQLVSHSSPPAIGDLNGDGRPEIVANKAGGGLVAFTYDTAAGAWAVLWRSTTDGTTPYEPTGSGWAGPSLYDLDGDGAPEVLRGGIVLDATGRLIDASLGLLTYSSGIFAVVADVDGDGAAELVAGHGVWEWSATERRWNAEPWSSGGTAPGHVALADFGDFPGAAGWPAAAPEVAVVSSGAVRVQTLDGTIVFGPVAIPAGGTGGPPTVADFDGDGRPEVASAGANAYAVFDLDCAGAPIGECASGRSDGILWSQPSQDASSNVTGSSVFDFEGDGRAEVVYGDECFLRVYDGRTGDVIFSQSRSSCTWYENPVIADLDGDFNAEIVIGDNFNCPTDPSGTGRDCTGFGLGPRQTDPLFAGLRCDEPTDCVSGVCDAGFCRCTADAECCAGAGCARAAFVCEAPPSGTPGTGNTCRASRPMGTRGIRVFRDAADRWVRSRMIWNQHAYHVTNVEEDGTIPSLGAARINWTEPGLNNFRQNVQGEGNPEEAPDLTSRSASPLTCATDGTGTLSALVCNRGTEPVGSDLSVGFYDGDPSAGATRLCQARTRGVLHPGTCEMVACTWESPPTSEPGVELWVVPDDEGETGECYEGNNASVFEGVFCPTIG